MSARDDIMAALARAGASADKPPHISPPPRPAISAFTGDAAITRFIATAKESLADVVEIPGWQDIPKAVAILVPEPMRASLAPDTRLQSLDWSHAPNLEISHFSGQTAPDATQPLGVSVALAGIAETGSLLFLSQPHTPTMGQLLPDTHVAIVERSTIVAGLNDALALAFAGDRPMTVNFITGPSRSGDIEMTLELGAHGPKRVIILLVGS